MTILNFSKDNSTRAILVNSLKLGLVLGALIGFIACECPGNNPTASVAVTNIQIIGDDPRSALTNSRGLLTARVLPENHTEGDVVWTSSSNEIISVTPIGDDTATFTAGEIVSSATITAMVGGERDTLTISVVTQAVAATDIEIQGENPLSILVDESGTLTALVTPANHTDGSTIWSSSEEAIVTIDSDSGEYRGLAEGRATITATVGLTTSPTPSLSM